MIIGRTLLTIHMHTHAPHGTLLHAVTNVIQSNRVHTHPFGTEKQSLQC